MQLHYPTVALMSCGHLLDCATTIPTSMTQSLLLSVPEILRISSEVTCTRSIDKNMHAGMYILECSKKILSPSFDLTLSCEKISQFTATPTKRRPKRRAIHQVHLLAHIDGRNRRVLARSRARCRE